MKTVIANDQVFLFDIQHLNAHTHAYTHTHPHTPTPTHTHTHTHTHTPHTHTHTIYTHTNTHPHHVPWSVFVQCEVHPGTPLDDHCIVSSVLDLPGHCSSHNIAILKARPVVQNMMLAGDATFKPEDTLDF